MSYSESFHSSITVSGTVTVHYPASQNGGITTASYQQTVPVDWTVFVDTDPFDYSVQSTEEALDVLTGSVVAMNDAQVRAIRASSQKVAKSLSGGFFNLIGKDLSENMVTQINTIRTKFALLMQYSKDLLAKQERMTDDISRLQRHYYNVFHNLDEDLNHRISALNSEAFALGQKSRENILRGPYLEEAAFCLGGIQEGDRTSNMLVSARTNSNVQSALDSLNAYVRKNLSYKETLSAVLDRDAAESETKEYVPVIVYEEKDMDRPGALRLSCLPPVMNGSQQAAAGVYQHVQGQMDSAWTAMDQEQLSKIDRNFCNYVEQDSQADQNPTNDRIHREIMKMWGYHKNYLMDIQVR